MAVWTDEQKKKVVEMYQEGNPTAANSTELVKEIAESLEASANGVRQVLVQAGVYVKKEVETSKGTTTGKAGDKAPRVTKESQIAELKELIISKGQEADDEVLNKLTGKAASYLVKVFS